MDVLFNVRTISYNVCIKLFMGFPQAFVEAERSN